jgi:D-3-phosphoglycerate dehydrogenase
MSDPLPLLWTDVPLHPEAWALLRERVQLSGPTVPSALAASTPFDFAAANAAIVGVRGTYDAAAFARAPRLQVIARTGIGYDNVDAAAATAAGVCAVNTPEAPTESTAEFAIALMFAVARRIPTADHNSKAGEWKLDPSVMGFDLAEKSLGLVGFGRIARRVTEMARAIRMRVHAFDPFMPAARIAECGVIPCANLPELLQKSQILSLHAPLVAATRRLIGADQLALLPKGAIVINTARGPLLDELAVLNALTTGHLAGAGIDVWTTEPTEPENPLFLHPRVVATPHMAAYTDEGRRRSHVTAARHVLSVFDGEAPVELINPTVWETRRK